MTAWQKLVYLLTLGEAANFQAFRRWVGGYWVCWSSMYEWKWLHLDAPPPPYIPTLWGGYAAEDECHVKVPQARMLP